MAGFILTMKDGTRDDVADELERLVGLLRQGFTWGYVDGGEWESEGDPEPEDRD